MSLLLHVTWRDARHDRRNRVLNTLQVDYDASHGLRRRALPAEDQDMIRLDQEFSDAVPPLLPDVSQ